MAKTRKTAHHVAQHILCDMNYPRFLDTLAPLAGLTRHKLYFIYHTIKLTDCKINGTGVGYNPKCGTIRKLNFTTPLDWNFVFSDFTFPHPPIKIYI